MKPRVAFYLALLAMVLSLIAILLAIGSMTQTKAFVPEPVWTPAIVKTDTTCHYILVNPCP
jgi:hypothetical protein